MRFSLALEVVNLAHSEGEMGWLGAGGVAEYNYALKVVILAHSASLRSLVHLLLSS